MLSDNEKELLSELVKNGYGDKVIEFLKEKHRDENMSRRIADISEILIQGGILIKDLRESKRDKNLDIGLDTPRIEDIEASKEFDNIDLGDNERGEK